jgi:glycosyltransferase involved in cell wall biosynthesis
MTIIEAMGTGLPVVASAVGGVPDMLTHQESGLLVSNGTEAIADAVCTLLESENLRRTLGTAAKIRSEAFSARYMAKAYSEVYKK